MSSNSRFLTIPLELRLHIYSYLLTNDAVVNIATQAMAEPLRNGIVRSCRQISDEMLDYYYTNNTFLLSLLNPVGLKPKLLQYLSRMQHLQVEFGGLTFASMDRTFILESLTPQRCDWFLRNLRKAKRGQYGRVLKSLVAIDRCGTSLVSE